MAAVASPVAEIVARQREGDAAAAGQRDLDRVGEIAGKQRRGRRLGGGGRAGAGGPAALEGAVLGRIFFHRAIYRRAEAHVIGESGTHERKSFLEQAIARLAHDEPELQPGHVWLAGAGPGDPGLLTLDVLSALAQADALVHDALVSDEVVAVASQAEKFFVGKRGGRLSIPQEEINALLVRLAKEGRKVVRLKGGHPLVFARGGEEALALAAENIPFRVLSGVTSAFGGLASAGIPATMRGVNGAVILATGFAAASDDRPDWAALARTGQPIVIYMGLTHMAATVADLLAGGLAEDTPAALVENATLPERAHGGRDAGHAGGGGGAGEGRLPCPDRDRPYRVAARETAGDDRPRDHHRRAALRLRQDLRDDRAAARAQAARHRRARREIGAGLYRSGLPRGGDGTRRRQPRQLGDAAGAARRAGGGGGG